MNDCCKDLEKLKRDFRALLIANGNTFYKKQITNVNNEFFNTNNGLEQQLLNEGFTPKVVKTVAAKMRKSTKRSSNDYSKKTGLLKKNR